MWAASEEHATNLYKSNYNINYNNNIVAVCSHQILNYSA